MGHARWRRDAPRLHTTAPAAPFTRPFLCLLAVRHVAAACCALRCKTLAKPALLRCGDGNDGDTRLCGAWLYTDLFYLPTAVYRGSG